MRVRCALLERNGGLGLQFYAGPALLTVIARDSMLPNWLCLLLPLHRCLLPSRMAPLFATASLGNRNIPKMEGSYSLEGPSKENPRKTVFKYGIKSRKATVKRELGCVQR